MGTPSTVRRDSMDALALLAADAGEQKKRRNDSCSCSATSMGQFSGISMIVRGGSKKVGRK